MVDENYLPQGVDNCLAHCIEECAELIQALCKAQRFGVNNTHPITAEPNINAIHREHIDLQLAIGRLEEAMK